MMPQQYHFPILLLLLTKFGYQSDILNSVCKHGIQLQN